MPIPQKPRASAPFHHCPKFRKWVDNPIYQGIWRIYAFSLKTQFRPPTYRVKHHLKKQNTSQKQITGFIVLYAVLINR